MVPALAIGNLAPVQRQGVRPCHHLDRRQLRPVGHDEGARNSSLHPAAIPLPTAAGGQITRLRPYCTRVSGAHFQCHSFNPFHAAANFFHAGQFHPSKPPANAKAFAQAQEYVVRDPVNVRWSEVVQRAVNPNMDQLWNGSKPAADVVAAIKAAADPLLMG